MKGTVRRGHITRFNREETWEAELERVPPGTELGDSDAVPHYVQGADGTFHEYYGHRVPEGLAVYRVPEAPDAEPEDASPPDAELPERLYGTLREFGVRAADRDAVVGEIAAALDAHRAGLVASARAAVRTALGESALWGGQLGVAVRAADGALEALAGDPEPPAPAPR